MFFSTTSETSKGGARNARPYWRCRGICCAACSAPVSDKSAGRRIVSILLSTLIAVAFPVSAAYGLEAKVLHAGFKPDTGAFVLLIDRGMDAGIETDADYTLSCGGRETGELRITGSLPESAVGALTPLTGARIPKAGETIEIAARAPGGPEQAPDAPAPQFSRMSDSRKLADAYKVGPGDVLKIVAYPENKLPAFTTIRPDGTVSLPFVGIIDAAGKTVFQISDEIQKILAKDFKHPWVEVTVGEYHSLVVRIYGQVETTNWRQSGTGEYSLKNNTNILEFLTSIGGLGKDADTRNLKIFRKDGGEISVNFQEVSENPESKDNIMLRNGDIIYVPSVQEEKSVVRVLLLGQVAKQGVMNLDPSHGTLLDAISEGGGFSVLAALDRVQIVRAAENGERNIRTVDASGMIAGSVPGDFKLKTGDLIYVPQRAEKKKAIARINNVLKDILPSLNFMYLLDAVKKD